MSAAVEKLGLSSELVSLFCGAGGLDLGFEQAGYSVGAAVDLRSFSIASYNHNRKRKTGYVGDLTALDPAKLDKLAKRTLKPVGIIGGPPCQSFSRAAHSSDDDHRHELPLEFSRLLDEFNQRAPVSFFAFENVPGLLKHRHKERLRKIHESFRDAGFSVHQVVLNASSFGVAQNRPRLILVGFNNALYPGLKWAPPGPTTPSPIPVREILQGLPDPVFWTREVDRMKIAHHVNHWCMTPKSKNFTTPGALIPGTSRGRSFRTLDWDQPSPTVAYGHREVHVHPDGRRRLSVYEALRLQGFPKNYELTGSLSQQITQVSEAVPPPLGLAIAKSIAEALQQYDAEAQASA
ncbi:DNA cytosine methyltransferase [Rhizobium laguerreae]|nr:DNA cytosine methyltransferase [Rhizobium laguerreae]